MTISSLVLSLKHEDLAELYNVLLDTGIQKEFGNKIRPIFKEKRKTSKGKLKKVYSFLAKCSEKDYETIYNSILTNLQ